MAVTQAQIDALDEAISNGERVVRHGDKTVEYRSIAELISARNALQAKLTSQANVAAGRTRSKQTRLYQGGRGFHE